MRYVAEKAFIFSTDFCVVVVHGVPDADDKFAFEVDLDNGGVMGNGEFMDGTDETDETDEDETDEDGTDVDEIDEDETDEDDGG